MVGSAPHMPPRWSLGPLSGRGYYKHCGPLDLGVGVRPGVAGGLLDDAPQFSAILEAGAEIHFHPKHLIGFWKHGMV